MILFFDRQSGNPSKLFDRQLEEPTYEISIHFNLLNHWPPKVVVILVGLLLEAVLPNKEILRDRGGIFVWSLKAAKSNRPIMAQNMPTILWANPLTTSFNIRWIRLCIWIGNTNVGPFFLFAFYSPKQLIHQSIFQRFFLYQEILLLLQSQMLGNEAVNKVLKVQLQWRTCFFFPTIFVSFKTWFNCLT